MVVIQPSHPESRYGPIAGVGHQTIRPPSRCLATIMLY